MSKPLGLYAGQCLSGRGGTPYKKTHDHRKFRDLDIGADSDLRRATAGSQGAPGMDRINLGESITQL
jgi:hypothetical protein